MGHYATEEVECGIILAEGPSHAEEIREFETPLFSSSSPPALVPPMERERKGKGRAAHGGGGIKSEAMEIERGW